MLPFVCDAAAAKQGKFMPGSHLPILSPEVLNSLELDFLVILPWNIAAEVASQTRSLMHESIKFVTAIPTIKIW